MNYFYIILFFSIIFFVVFDLAIVFYSNVIQNSQQHQLKLKLLILYKDNKDWILIHKTSFFISGIVKLFNLNKEGIKSKYKQLLIGDCEILREWSKENNIEIIIKTHSKIEELIKNNLEVNMIKKDRKEGYGKLRWFRLYLTTRGIISFKPPEIFWTYVFKAK